MSVHRGELADRWPPSFDQTQVYFCRVRSSILCSLLDTSDWSEAVTTMCRYVHGGLFHSMTLEDAKRGWGVGKDAFLLRIHIRSCVLCARISNAYGVVTTSTAQLPTSAACLSVSNSHLGTIAQLCPVNIGLSALAGSGP